MANTIQLRAQALRRQIRHGNITGSTSGLAETMQANLIVLPSQYAEDFHNLCRRNPVPCPLLERISAGCFTSKIAQGSDLRTDIPAYNMYEDGLLIHHAKSDVLQEWTEDHVGFLIGCSYSFETALAKAGLAPISAKLNKAVPMFISNIPLNPAGVFQGHYVVSMRSYTQEGIPKVREITKCFIKQHGEPVAWGWDGAERIGVRHKLENGIVDFGDLIPVPADQIPVFWGCGVTPQIAVMESKVKGIVLSHLPGSMFVTDLDPADESVLL